VGSLQKYESVLDILKEFFTLRIKYYTLRKEWLLGMLGAESSKLSNQARFILEKIQGTLVIGGSLPNPLSHVVVVLLFLNSAVRLPLREQAQEAADLHAAGDGLRLRPCQGLEGRAEGKTPPHGKGKCAFVGPLYCEW